MSQGRLLPERLRKPAEKAPAICDDLIYGAEAIRVHLKLKKVRQVYHLREKGKAPIFEMEGIGLAARKSSLDAWIKRLEDQVANSNEQP
jgi:hypothetical protein